MGQVSATKVTINRLLTQRAWRRTTMILFHILSGCFNVHLIIFVTSMALYTLTDKTIRASIFGEIIQVHANMKELTCNHNGLMKLTVNAVQYVVLVSS